MNASFAGDFLVSIETECLTSVKSALQGPELAIQLWLGILESLAPSLSGGNGFFNSYGRVYIDCNWHIELAACECASPYDLPSIVERQQILAAQAVTKLKSQGHDLLLANNNHSGLLTKDAATWGTHENYLTERHPATFAKLILPFLVTRLFGGSGGIESPSGNFLAGVRPLRMDLASGGGTTDSRAIHSTARDEGHMDQTPGRYRYHLILGDGHASHFNLALQMGSTALALKAIFYDGQLQDQLRRFEATTAEEWVALLKRLNVLAPLGQAPGVDPLVIEVQRMYLAAARRYATGLERRPGWIDRLLEDWTQTLNAMERMDLDWLSARLDAFIKYRFYTAVLAEQGKRWKDLSRNRALFHELALLDQSYHAFCEPDSVFRRLDGAGVLQHRVFPRIEPGGEAEPYCPNVETRADARARLIVKHAGTRDFLMNWSVAAGNSGQVLSLNEPFGKSYVETSPAGQPVPAHIAALRLLRHRLMTDL